MTTTNRPTLKISQLSDRGTYNNNLAINASQSAVLSTDQQLSCKGLVNDKSAITGETSQFVLSSERKPKQASN